MTDDTFTYDGVELDIEDTLRAIELVTDDDGNTENNTAIVGDVAIIGDTFSDGDATVAHADNVSEAANGNVYDIEGPQTFTTVSMLRDSAEDARGPNFIDYLEEQPFVYTANDVRADGDLLGGYDAVIHYEDDTPEFKSSEISGLADDENVSLGGVEADGNTIELGVNDVRDA